MRTASLLVLLLAGAAVAADRPEEARKLALRDGPGRQPLSWSASVPAPVAPSASPLTVGATLVVRAGSGESASFDLPAAGWTVNASGTTYKYMNELAPAGPSAVKRVTVKSQRFVKVAGKGTGITLDEATQGAVSIALTIGADVYCSTCTAPRQDEPGRYVATRCPAPPSCATPTTTTPTTTSTTTSSFVPAVCGNGVAEGTEQCDGMDPGVCVEAPIPLACDPPTSPNGGCRCCLASSCVIGTSPLGVSCCNAARCQDVTGVGMFRGGACIPSSCTQDAQCNGYRCVGGTCCGNAGQLCGVVSCCPDAGATCSGVVWLGSPVCCRTAGAACSTFNECCSGSCTGSVCD